MASEYTPNYNLDLYVSEDKPNLRDQYNSAVRKIDSQMKKNADDVTQANASIVTMQAQVTTATGNISELQSTVASQGEKLEATTATATNAKATADANAEKLETVEANVATNTTDISVLKNQVSCDGTNISTLQTQMASANSNIQQNATAVAGKAPISHASSEATYGIGTSSNFGHVKLSDSLNDATHDANAGVASTPKAVYDAIHEDPEHTIITSGFESSGVSGTLQILKKDNIVILEAWDLRITNSSASSAFVRILDLTANAGIYFDWNFQQMGNVFATSDASNFRLARVVKESDGNVHFEMSMPANTTYTFIGQIAFICSAN